MKAVFPYTAALAAAALSFSLVAIPAPAQFADPVPVAKAEIAPPPHDCVQPYAHTAIGAVIEANGWQVPATGMELTAALAKLGDFVQLPVSFSAVALDSGLSHPRVVITMRPSTHPPTTPPPSSGGGGGWGGSGGSGGSARAATPPPLGSTAANRPYLEGRLFLAANTEIGRGGNPVVKTVEFISWNSRQQKFDFGVIEGMGGSAELKMLDGTRCFSCHKNHGPILGVAPWSNTAHNDLVRKTSAPLFKFPGLLDKDGKENPSLGRRTDIDGLKLLSPSGPEVDAAVRRGAEVLRDRERFRLLARSADGRKAFAILLSAIATRGPIDKLDQKLRLDINQLDLVAFLHSAHAANKAAIPSTLADYSPAGPVARPILKKGPGGSLNQVAMYDALRATGESVLPTEFQPSNPKAFVRPTLAPPTQPSQLLSAVMLARAIGLSEDDRAFLATALDEGMKRMNRSRFTPTDLTPATLVREVFNGPAFADVLREGVLPERDDFKDRFVAGLIEAGWGPQTTETFWHARAKYASGPRFEALLAEPEPAAPLPSHACAACHDFRTGPKPAAFNPIPALAFDPFDAAARDNWLSMATPKQKKDTLGRLARRLGKDRDMPPEDSVEAELYRVKDPTALDALTEWLTAELKKVK